MTHVLTESALEKPLARLMEATSVVSPAQRIKSSKGMVMIFLLSGSSLISGAPGGPKVFEGGDILLLPEGVDLKQQLNPARREPRSHVFSLHFESARNAPGDPFLKYVQSHVRQICFLSHGQTQEIRGLISQIRREVQDSLGGAIFKASALSRCLVVEAIRQMDLGDTSRRPPTRSRAHITNQAKEYLARNHQQTVRLSEIAWHLNLSEEHLCRLFKAETGMTLFNFLNRYRVEYAKEALMQSNRPITKIAEQAGFSSATLFSRQFKLQSGMSPMEYRMAYGGRFGTQNRSNSRM